ncbi:MAG: hypothetical protein RIC03_04455 [Cyclobacteriaceae bacterium]
MKNIDLSRVGIYTVILLLSGPLLAQGAPPATPIDGGLSMLLVAGGAYGLKKIYDNRK